MTILHAGTLRRRKNGWQFKRICDLLYFRMPSDRQTWKLALKRARKGLDDKSNRHEIYCTLGCHPMVKHKIALKCIDRQKEILANPKANLELKCTSCVSNDIYGHPAGQNKLCCSKPPMRTDVWDLIGMLNMEPVEYQCFKQCVIPYENSENIAYNSIFAFQICNHKTFLKNICTV